jgi:hypothetical protein
MNGLFYMGMKNDGGGVGVGILPLRQERHLRHIKKSEIKNHNSEIKTTHFPSPGPVHRPGAW